jgi:hypothetical protein
VATPFALASISDLGQRGTAGPVLPTIDWAGYSYGPNELRIIHEQLDPLIVALTYAGYDPRTVILATADEPEEILVIELGPRSGAVRVSRAPAPTAFTVETGLDLPAAPMTACVPLVERAGLATVVDMEGAGDGAYIVMELTTVEPSVLAGEIADAANPLAGALVDAIVAQWDSAGTDGTGLLALVHPDEWIIGDDQVEAEAFSRLADKIIGPVFLDAELLRLFLQEETAPRVVGSAGPPTVRARIEQAGLSGELEPTDAHPREIRRGWTDAARDRYPSEPPAPFRLPDHRRFTYTELVLDAFNQGCITSGLLAAEGGEPSDALAEGRRILDEVAAELRTDDEWAALARFVPLQLPFDSPLDAPGARAADELVSWFPTFATLLAITVIGELTSAMCLAPPSTVPADLEAEMPLIIEDTTAFESYCRRVVSCLGRTIDNPDQAAYLEQAVDRCRDYLDGIWDDTWGPPQKLAMALVELPETCIDRDTILMSIGQAIALWDEAVVDEASAPAAWLVWDLFHRVTIMLYGCRKAPTWTPDLAVTLESVFDRVMLLRVPTLHAMSDEQLEQLQQEYVTQLMDVAHTTAYGTTQSKYYHLLVAQSRYGNVTDDFDWRRLVDAAQLGVAASELRATEEVQAIEREAHIAACRAVLGLENIDVLAFEQSNWIRSDVLLGLVLLAPDSQARLQGEIDRLAAVDEVLAQRTLIAALSAASQWHAFEAGLELFSEDQLRAAYEALLLEIGVDAREALTLMSQFTGFCEQWGSAVTWLARTPHDLDAPMGTFLLDFEQNVGVVKVNRWSHFTLLAAVAVGVLFAADQLVPAPPPEIDLDLPPLLTTIGLTAQVIADGLDVLAVGKKWYWVIPPFPTRPAFPSRASLMLLAPEGIGCISYFHWAVTTLVPARAAQIASTYARYMLDVTRWTGWRVTVAFRVLASICELTVGALAEGFMLLQSICKAWDAAWRGEWAIVRAETVHIAASTAIIVGSLAAAWAVFMGVTVPVWASAAVFIGIGVHIAVWFLGPEAFEAGRLESDLRELGVRPTHTELSPIDGWLLSFGTGGYHDGFLIGEPVARYFSGELPPGPRPDMMTPTQIEEFPATAETIAPMSGVVVEGAYSAQYMVAGQEVGKWGERFMHDLYARPGALERAGDSGLEVVAGDFIGRVVPEDGSEGYDWTAPEAGTVVWYDEPLPIGVGELLRYGVLFIAIPT